MKICVLTDSYGQAASMNGIIAEKLVNYLQKEKNEIWVVKYDRQDCKMTDENGCHIVGIRNLNQSSTRYLEKKIASSKRTKRFWRMILNCKRAGSFAIRYTHKLYMNWPAINTIYKSIDKLHAEQKFDIVISIAVPFEGFEAVCKLKRHSPMLKVVLYQVDLFESFDMFFLTRLHEKYVRKNRKERQLYYLNACDSFVCYDFVYDQEFKNINENKVKICRLPLIDSVNEYANDELKKEIDIVYTGSLDLTNRSPQKFLQLFETIIANSVVNRTRLHFYYRGYIGKLLDDYVKKYPDNIFNHGTVSVEEAHKAMENASFLLSISTVKGNQVAGKTYEYISTGKPIIYVYFNPNDVNKKVYDEYPLALCINISDVTIGELSNQVKEFLLACKGQRVAGKCIRDKFKDCTPEYIAHLLCE